VALLEEKYADDVLIWDDVEVGRELEDHNVDCEDVVDVEVDGVDVRNKDEVVENLEELVL
jgi:hypothetical protein